VAAGSSRLLIVIDWSLAIEDSLEVRDEETVAKKQRAGTCAHVAQLSTLFDLCFWLTFY